MKKLFVLLSVMIKLPLASFCTAGLKLILSWERSPGVKEEFTEGAACKAAAAAKLI